MKIKLQISSLIMYIVEIGCIFTPFWLRSELWTQIGMGRFSRERVENTMFFVIDGLLGVVLPLLVVVAVVIPVVILIVSVAQKKDLSKSVLLSGIVSFITFVVYTIIVCNYRLEPKFNATYYYDFTLNWMFYIIVILHVINIVLSFVAYTKGDEPAIVKETSEVQALNRYKELFDMGAITQAEFVQKRNELLGMNIDVSNRDKLGTVRPNIQQYICPRCKAFVFHGDPVCKNCGTAFNW